MYSRTEIEKFCIEVLGMTGDSTTADIMRRVVVEAIEKWEVYTAEVESI
jgi:hypothetical protein